MSPPAKMPWCPVIRSGPTSTTLSEKVAPGTFCRTDRSAFWPRASTRQSAFLQRLLDLDVVGWHLHPGPAVHHDGFGRAEAASYFAGPSSALYSHCWMFSPAGYALLHGGRLCT